MMPVRQHLIAGWAVGGVILLLVEAIARLGARAIATVASGLDGPQRLACLLVVAGFAYGEGYLALHRRFAPMVVRRALDTGKRARGCFAVLGAPLEAVSLVRAPAHELRRAWLGVGAIVVAMLGVRALPEPWRGIVDAGVVAALVWGVAALSSQFVRAVARADPSPFNRKHNQRED